MRLMHENQSGHVGVEEAVRLHRALGPGRLEAVYETSLSRLLTDRGLVIRRQVPVPIEFKGIRFEEGFRADIVVEGKVLLEVKSIEKVHNAHKKQVLTYMKLTGIKLGYLLNFGADTMRNGITRTINGNL